MPKTPETSAAKLDKHLRDVLAVSGTNRRSMMLNSFLRGIAQGFGAIVGGTILVAFLIWLLSLFDEIPFLGPAIDAISKAIDK